MPRMMNADKGSSLSISNRILEALKAHPEGISINALRLELQLDTEDQQHLDRRLRDLDPEHIIHRKRSGRETLYLYVGPRQTKLDYEPINKKTRSEVLWRAQGRCQMCGRSVEEGVKLHVDHKMPQSWGGPTELDNLWALCSTCNEGKKNFFSTIQDPRIQRSMLHPSVHVRLGEMLKAFEGTPIPAQYLELVAYTHDDWQKRLRELREIGWDYTVSKKTDPKTGRVNAYYSLVKSAPWPENPAAEIRAAERRKNSKR